MTPVNQDVTDRERVEREKQLARSNELHVARNERGQADPFGEYRFEMCFRVAVAEVVSEITWKLIMQRSAELYERSKNE